MRMMLQIEKLTKKGSRLVSVESVGCKRSFSCNTQYGSLFFELFFRLFINRVLPSFLSFYLFNFDSYFPLIAPLLSNTHSSTHLQQVLGVEMFFNVPSAPTSPSNKLCSPRWSYHVVTVPVIYKVIPDLTHNVQQVADLVAKWGWSMVDVCEFLTN